MSQFSYKLNYLRHSMSASFSLKAVHVHISVHIEAVDYFRSPGLFTPFSSFP